MPAEAFFAVVGAVIVGGLLAAGFVYGMITITLHNRKTGDENYPIWVYPCLLAPLVVAFVAIKFYVTAH